ncbi:MAG: MinD/ParA family protein [Clostridiales bacterium]|nr:MinD/ParA family protein [Clostridiales bacterium]
MDQAERLRALVRQKKIPNNSAKVITITSGKGGVGKSSISVNLAIQFSKMGKRTVILDADFGLANIEVMMGVRPRYNLADLIYEKKSIDSIITVGPQNISFISGGSGIQELSNLTKEQITFLIQSLAELDERADIIIVDTGAGISDAVLEFVAASQEVILVVTPEPTSITDAYALLKTLNRRENYSNPDRAISLITNRTTSVKEGLNIYNKLNAVSGRFLDFNLEYLGAVPQDNIVSKSIIYQKPASLLYPNSSFTKSITEIAEKICPMENDMSNKKRGISQVFSNLLKLRKN